MTDFDVHPDWREAGGWTTLADTDDPADVLFGDLVESTSPGVAGEFDVVLVGEPYDDAVIGRPGAIDGPVAIRRALASLKAHHYDVGPMVRVGDLGDLGPLIELLERDRGHVEPVERAQRRIASVATEVHQLEAFPVFLGGDNSLTVPNVEPLLADHRVGCVNLDAHLDVREVRAEPTSGSPYRQLLESGLDGYVCLGARHFETSTAYHQYVHEQGGTVITAETVGADPPAAARGALEALGDVDVVYVSLDLDVLDVTAAPGVSAPTPGGLPTRELFGVLRLLARDERVAGFEVVECAPRHDRAGRTAAAGARAVAHFLAGYVGARR